MNLFRPSRFALKWTCLTGKIGHQIHAGIGIISVNSFIWGADKFDRFPKRMEKNHVGNLPLFWACEKYSGIPQKLNHQPANLMFSYCLLCFPITYIPTISPSYPHTIPILSRSYSPNVLIIIISQPQFINYYFIISPCVSSSKPL